MVWLVEDCAVVVPDSTVAFVVVHIARDDNWQLQLPQCGNYTHWEGRASGGEYFHSRNSRNSGWAGSVDYCIMRRGE